MDVTLLYFDDCPNWKVAAGHLQLLASEFPGIEITRLEVTTPEDAERLRFRGSPSIVIDGVDVFSDAEAPVGLSCRVYQTPDGPSGSPTLAQLREAISGG